jgi:hypothetical protein
MQINLEKSSLMAWRLSDWESLEVPTLFGVQLKSPTEGLKYLGFTLKASGYRKTDWAWLLAKVEKGIISWCNKWLSRAGRLVLLKSIIEAIPVYWTSLAWVPKGVHKITQMVNRFLWADKEDSIPLVLASEKNMSRPKSNAGWKLKDIFTFAKSLATENTWSLVNCFGLWHRVIKEKYIPQISLLEWICSPNISSKNGTIIWKASSTLSISVEIG